ARPARRGRATDRIAAGALPSDSQDPRALRPETVRVYLLLPRMRRSSGLECNPRPHRLLLNRRRRAAQGLGRLTSGSLFGELLEVLELAGAQGGPSVGGSSRHGILLKTCPLYHPLGKSPPPP